MYHPFIISPHLECRTDADCEQGKHCNKSDGTCGK